ncbi:MAG: hypothetical protein FWF77_04765 [Defluviitaleaceae bacterium]|nr:hypothetical protein [Defluviitaleaceae bacterium]
MFLRHLKHDLLFGKNMFIALGISIVIAAVAGLIAFHVIEEPQEARNIINISIFLVLGLVLGFVAVHLSQFIEKSMFGDAGYLALTLPITRGRLLISKILAAFVWFNYVLLTVFICMIILQPTQQYDGVGDVIIPPLGMNLIAIYLNLFFVFIFSTNLMLFGLTLHNSVFGKWKVPGFVTSILCLGTVFGYASAAVRMINRHMELVTEYHFHEFLGQQIRTAVTTREPIMGLSVGRLEMFGSHLDLQVAGMGLILGLAAFFATWYLLKRRVSLQ